MAFAFASALSVVTFAAAAEPRDPVPARDAKDVSAPNTSQRRPPATPRRRAGSVTQAPGPQHPVQNNGEALRSTLRAPAHGGGLRHPPMAGKATAHSRPIAGGSAPNSAQVRPLSTGSPSAISASGHVPGTQPVAPNAITAGRGMTGSQSVALNRVPANRRPPTGLVTIGGAVTNHNATRGVLDGNSVHRRF